MTSATSDAATTTGARLNKHRRATTSRGVSALMYASQQGDVERVRKIIAEQPTTLLTRDRSGKTPLHYCSTSDNICAAQAADLLVMAAPDLVDSRDEDGFTPLHLAVIAGNMPLVTFLLANKADVNAVDNEKHTVVHWATVCGETAALRAVLAAGAPVSTPDVHGGYPLHYAAQMCGGERDSDLGMQVMQTLLTHSDIVVTVEDGDGRQPLLWAASAGSAKAVLALVRAGAAVESPDKDGLTALHCAASRGHTDCIDSLLTLCGASPDVIDSNGCTALHYAVTLGHADATALLLAHGADPNRQDRKGRTPAHCGCAKGQFETVKMIGARGANLWLRNARGDLPLHEAAASGRRDLVRWLLEMRSSQVNARNNDGRCPLHLAALNDNADMCKILLDAGAQVNPILRTSKNTFMTPLDCALQRGFRSTAKYLQLHGGVPSTRIGDLRHTQANAGVNLQIKDDVTFWGDTSSDSERENGDANKYNKRIQRKKLSHKYDKKRASLSGSDVEHNKLVSGKSEPIRRRKFGEKNQKVKADYRTDSAASSDLPKKSKRPPTTKLDYSNEIIINGRTEINIHSSKQVNIDAEEETNIPSNVSTEIAEKVLQEVSSHKEKRPKSAKSGKKSTKLPEKPNSAKKKIINKNITSNEKQGNIAQSNNEKITKEQIITTEAETKESSQQSDNSVPNKAIDALLDNQQNLGDQQSIMSNTSEDVDEHKSLIVEAAVHEPPKKSEEKIELAKKNDQETQQTTERVESQLVSKETTEFSKVSLEKETDVNSVTDTHMDKNNEQVTVQVEDAADLSQVAETDPRVKNLKIEHSDTIDKKQKVTETEIDSEVVLKKDQHEQSTAISRQTSTENSPKVLHQEEGNKNTDSSKTQLDFSKNETEVQSVEETLNVTESDKLVEENGANTEVAALVSFEASDVNTEIVASALPEENDVNTEVAASILPKQNNINTEEVVSRSSETNDVNTEVVTPILLEDNKVNTVTSILSDKDNVNTEAVASMLSEENKVTESVLPTENLETAIKANEEIDDDVIKKQDSDKLTEKNDVNDTEKSPKEKPKKKNRKKQKNIEDQAYEIIYKTLGAEENDTDINESVETKKPNKVKLKAQKTISETKSSDEYSSELESESSTSTSPTVKEHKSFRILDEKEAEQIDSKRTKPKKVAQKFKGSSKKQRSRSEENKKEIERTKKNNIPAAISKSQLSKSDRYLHIPDRKTKSSMESRVPSLPNINEKLKEPPRPDSNMSAPLLASVYSDDEVTASDGEKVERGSATKRKKIKRKSKTREARSAGSDYESSNVIDSGFEPSPRSSRIPKWKNMSERGVNMSSVTQSIQSNIRRYHLERKIFQHLLELKRMQIRAGQHNEAILVKRAIDAYHQSCAATVGAGRYIPEDYSFKSFEKFLYLSLRKLQRNGADHLKGLPESPANPLLCTQSTHRCMHATHAYTGIPCAAYLPKMDHHTIPKIGFTSTQCKPGTGFLPTINPKKAVTLELCHGNDKQVISLPADRLDQNKRYYVTFTVKGSENTPPNEKTTTSGHRHSKSD